MGPKKQHGGREKGKPHLELSQVKMKMTLEVNLDNDVNNSIQSLERIASGKGGNKASSLSASDILIKKKKDGKG